MNSRLTSLLVLFALIAFQTTAQRRDRIEKIRPILEQHCFPCHHDTKRSAGISLKNIFMGINDTEALMVRDGRVWMNSVKQIQSGEMPPRSKPRLSHAEYDTLVKTINEILYSSLAASNPGRVVMRRLSHTEYQYSVFNLVGVNFDAPSNPAPPDPSAGNFEGASK